MFTPDDTIVAIATPQGRAGLGVVRLSGPAAGAIAAALTARPEPFAPRHATFARLSAGGIQDQVVVTVFPGPQSYTGQDVAEISAHGSPLVLQSILRAALAAGARLAEPGEFTFRAYLNGRLDLIQAEAVADLIDAVTPAQARAAFDQLEGTLTGAIGGIEADLFDLIARLEASLDFPDEGYHFVAPDQAIAELRLIRERVSGLVTESARGRLLRDGAQIAIVGSPNVGKSSLFNALLNAERAIVTAIPGTTRDLVTERADVCGIPVGLVDTAGVRESTDAIEREGIARARHAAAIADLTLVVLDRSRPLGGDDRDVLGATASRPRLLVANKIDRPSAWDADVVGDVIRVSATTGEGVAALIDQIAARLGATGDSRDTPVVTNVRHAALLQNAQRSLDEACRGLEGPAAVSEEFVLSDLQAASASLQEITGRRTTDDLLRHIFARFCIGK